MALVTIARDGMLFPDRVGADGPRRLFSRPPAADDRREVRRAGWIYLIATHLGTLCLFAMFALWHRRDPVVRLGRAFPRPYPAPTAAALFTLALVASASSRGDAASRLAAGRARQRPQPRFRRDVRSHAQDGVYGIVRTTAPAAGCPALAGYALLAAGAISSVAGIAFAVASANLNACSPTAHRKHRQSSRWGSGCAARPLPRPAGLGPPRPGRARSCTSGTTAS
jgi:hypothetical protein